MHHVTHYCQSQMLEKQTCLNAFKSGFRTVAHQPSWGLDALDKYLAGFHFENAITEPAPTERLPQPPDLKVWATFTVHAFQQNNPNNHIEQQDRPAYEKKKFLELVGSIYCHWDYLLRKWVSERKDDRAFGNDAKTQELIEICEILKDSAFSQYIQDRHNVLPNSSKHAVVPLPQTLLTFYR
jgi:hypothetical protein